MKKLILSAIALSIASAASAEMQINVDPASIPAGATIVSVTAEIGAPFVPGTMVDANFTDFGGTPARHFFVWQYDGMFAPGANIVSNFFITIDCGGSMVTGTYTPAPFSTFYNDGIAPFPAGDTDFGLDMSMDCSGAVVDTEDTMPTAFGLGNAYPNPFNPSTTISFAVPAMDMVNLSIFNITGQKVATLVNENLVAGNHEIVFDASALSSGVYLYTMEAGSFSETKKMVLVK